MKKIYLSILFLLSILNAEAQQWEWARKANHITNFQEATDICTDNTGNVYMLGINYGHSTFNSTLLDSGAFIIKYNSSGAFQWGINIGGWPQKIHCDAADNLYVLGNFDSDISIASVHLHCNGNHDFFLARFDAGSSLVWAKAFGSTGDDGGFDFALDADGSSYLTGSYQDSITMDSFTLSDSTSIHALSFFLAKISSAGNVEWANSGPFNNSSSAIQYYNGKAIRLTKTGSMYILGQYLHGYGDECASNFIMKCNLHGDSLLTRNNWDNCFNSTDALAVDDNSNLFYIFNTTGHYWYTPLLSKYDSLLNHQWSLNLSDGAYYAKYCLATGLSVDTEGNIYVAGEFGSTMPGDGDSVTAYNRLLIRRGKTDLLIGKFDGNSNCLWLKKAGGRNSEFPQTMVLDNKGTMYVTGTYNYTYPDSAVNDTVLFDSNLLTNDSTWFQTFVAKLNPPFISNQSSIQKPKSEISIFPNPTHSTFTLHCPVSILNCQLKIYNSFGAVVHQQIITSAYQQIDLSGEGKGIYLLELHYGVKTELEKIVLD